MEGFSLFDEQEQDGDGEANNAMMQTFIQELDETLQNIENALIDLESSPNDASRMNHTFRLFHNLKGSSSMMECTLIKEIAHYAETLLDLGRSGEATLDSSTIDLFLEALEALKKLSSNLEKNGKEGEFRDFMLLSKLQDKTIKLKNSEKQETELVDENAETQKTTEKAKESDQVRVSRSVIEQMMLLVGEFMQLKNKINWLKSKYTDRDYYDNCQELDQFSSKLQRNILKLRLSPVRPIFHSMRRVVRTTVNQTGKNVELEISGEDTLLDRSILDIISDPLIHMIRNAIDHGIEDTQTRLHGNKPEVGHVQLKALYRAGEVHISVGDDGGGLDAAKLKRKAIEKGLITETQASTMSVTETYQIIFLAGFSGAETVTETSGRGVGMDVVKEAISTVGGQIDIFTELGVGTTFVIRLPLSLAIVECLGFNIGKQTYAVPQLNVEEVISTSSSFAEENVKYLESGSKVLLVRESPAPILDLGDILDQPSSVAEALILVRHGKDRFVLEVGMILGPLSIVSQPMPPAYAENSPFSGVTKQGDGSLLFQLDISRLYDLIKSRTAQKSKKNSDANRGTAGTNQEGALLTTSDIRRLQQKTMVFRNNLHFCLPVQRAKRIIFIQRSEIKEIGKGGKTYVTIEGTTIPLIWVEEILLRKKREVAQNYYLLVIQNNESVFGIPMVDFLGIKRMPDDYDTNISERGILGSTVIEDETCLAIDIPALVAMYNGIPEEKKKTKQEFNILFAEDDKFFASELKASLTGAGYNVILCEDGMLAKEYLSDPENVEKIDLVITDIEMPNMTGLALCRWIKSNPATKKLPVVAYTAITTEEMQNKMKSAGALAFVSKMALDELLQSIDKIIKGRKIQQIGEIDHTAKSSVLRNDRVVTFKLGTDWYALPMGCIKEVSPINTSADVPKTQNWLKKITSFRGMMIPILDIQKFFNLSDWGKESEQAVVEVNDVVFAIKVGKIGEVIISNNLKSGEGLPSISDKEEKITRYVAGVYQYNHSIISVLNPEKLHELCSMTKE